MPPALLVDLSEIDVNGAPIVDAAGVEAVNPHRHEMRLLDGVLWQNDETIQIVGFHDVREDMFWVRGHIPGRPLMPGVLMVEAAAQLASYYIKVLNKDDRFIGFGGIEDVRFRGTVVPGDRLVLLGKMVENRARRFICAAQGVVRGQMVFQAKIIGMPV